MTVKPGKDSWLTPSLVEYSGRTVFSDCCTLLSLLGCEGKPVSGFLKLLALYPGERFMWP